MCVSLGVCVCVCACVLVAVADIRIAPCCMQAIEFNRSSIMFAIIKRVIKVSPMHIFAVCHRAVIRFRYITGARLKWQRHVLNAAKMLGESI